MGKYTRETFIDKANEVHNGKYLYDKVEYKNITTKICVICPEHGEFWQTPEKHLAGQGCPICARKHRETTSGFIYRAKKIHGDRYDYSYVDYKDSKTPVKILCKEHGLFEQKPVNHLRGKGCPVCGGGYRHTNEQFIADANKIHGGIYDYSKTQYHNAYTKVCIICPEHGEFWQTPHAHLNGQGCPKCNGVKKGNTENFVKNARKVHGNKYDYSRVEYVNNRTKVCIICPEHGEFWQTPYKHLSGQGCPKCSGKIYTWEGLVNEFNRIHGNKYTYKDSGIKTKQDKITISCPEHGEFIQQIQSHLSGKGCPKCAVKRTSEKLKLPYDEFVKRANLVHNNAYDYSNIEYKNLHDRILLSCKIHGDFTVTVEGHLSGCHCPACSNSTSNSENEIYEYVKKILPKEKIIRRDSTLIPPKEIDIYIPSKKIGIEYNGLYWHSERFEKDKNYHLKKTDLCKNIGINLIHIFEDEYINHKDIVLSKISHILGAENNKKKIYGRKCVVKNIGKDEAKNFLEENHIQGYAASSQYIGAFFNDTLIGVMTFKREKDEGKWELNRCATDIKSVCCGVSGKMFKYFLKTYKPKQIKSFADRRWTLNEDENLYTKMGFITDGYVKPDYRYSSSKTGLKRLHKFNFRKNILHRKYNLPIEMTENEMTETLGFYKVWDCGLIKYIWKNPGA